MKSKALLYLLFILVLFSVIPTSASLNKNAKILNLPPALNKEINAPKEIKGFVLDKERDHRSPNFEKNLGEDYLIEWYLVKQDFSYWEYVVAIKNLRSGKNNFDLTLFFKELNSETSEIEDVKVEEYNPSFEQWEKNSLDKKLTKDSAEFNKGKVKFANREVKYFKVSFNSPLKKNEFYGGFESKGIVGLLNKEDGYIYHPPFYNAYTAKRGITITANEDIPAQYSFNFTGFDSQTEITGGDLLPDCSDLRVVINDTTPIPIRVIGCNTTNTELHFNLSHAIPNGQIYSDLDLYYGNTSAVSFYDFHNNTRTIDLPYDEDQYTLLLYHFDEGTGTNAYDNSTLVGTPRAYNVSATAPIWNTTYCKFGNCMFINGSSANYLFQNTNDYDDIEGTALTVDVWFTYAGSAAANGETLFGFEDGDDNNLWRIRMSDSKRVYQYNVGGTEHGLTLAYPTYPQGWVHSSWTIGGSGGQKVWINGTLTSQNGNTTQLGADTRGLYIGSNRVNADMWTDGNIDEFRVSNVDRGQPLHLDLLPTYQLGNEAGEGLYFFPNYTQTYLSTVAESSTANFQLNLSFNTSTVTSMDSNFTYDGTRYTSVSELYSSQGFRSFDIDVTVPSVDTDQVTKNFLWNLLFNLTNGTKVTDTSITGSQTIRKLSIIECGASNDTVDYTLNFTLMEETNLTYFSDFGQNGTFEATFWIWNDDKVENTTYTFDLTGNSWSFCIFPKGESFQTQARIDYNSENYEKRQYYFINKTLDDTLDNISLYLLATSEATGFPIEVKNELNTGLEDRYVKVQKYDAATNSYLDVVWGLTDTNGEDYIYLNKFDTFYKFLIYDNEENLIYTSSLLKISDASLSFTIIPDTIIEIIEYFETLPKNVLTFINTTNTFRYSYGIDVPVSTEISQVCLYAFQWKNYKYSELCSNCTASRNTTLTCYIGSDATKLNSTLVGMVYAKINSIPKTQIIESITLTFWEAGKEAVSTVGSLFFSVLIVGTISLAAAWNAGVGIILIIVSILLMNVIGFIQLPYVAIVSVIIVGGIIFIKLRK